MAKIGLLSLENISEGGGLNIYIRNLVEALAEYPTQHDYFIIVPVNNVGSWNNRNWPRHIHFTYVDTDPKQDVIIRAYNHVKNLLIFKTFHMSQQSMIAKNIDALCLDIIHAPTTVLQNMEIKTPILLTYMDMQHEYYPDFFTPSVLEYRAKTHRSSVAKAKHLIAPSNFTKQSLIEKFGVVPEKISVIPAGWVPSQFTRANKEEIERVSRKYQLPSDFIFYPANPWPHKNHARLMSSLRNYEQKFGKAPTLVISGRMPNEPRDARLYALAAGIENNVIDVGYLPKQDLRAIYSSAKMLIFPSLFEGFGIPLIEAMAIGCPIAAAHVTSIPECVGNAGYYFDPTDIEGMTLAIYSLMTDNLLREKLIEIGFEQVKLFSQELVIRKQVAIYDQMTAL